MTTHKGWRALALAVAVIAIGAVTVSAQEQGVAPPPGESEGTPTTPETYGFALTVHPLNSWAFEHFDTAAVSIGDGQNGRQSTSGNTCFEAPILIPNGARIDHIELDACDTNAGADVSATLFVCAAGACTTPYSVSTSGSPGCVRLSSATGTTTIDNNANNYTQQVCTSAAGSTVRYRGVRVFYQLRVRPGPAVATFNDVPTTHIFFQFIEALAASGITAGCNTPPGAFCPGAAVTRGQMAAFLAIALGLHFPN